MVKEPTNNAPRGGSDLGGSRKIAELRTMPAPDHRRIAAAQARSCQLLDAAVAKETAAAGSSRPGRRQVTWILAGINAAAAAAMVTALVVLNQPTITLEPPANLTTGGVNSPTGGTDAPTDGVATSDGPATMDPFGLVPVGQVITFRYAIGLVDGRCSPTGNDTFT